MIRPLIKIFFFAFLCALAFVLLAPLDLLGLRRSRLKAALKLWLVHRLNYVCGFKITVEGAPVQGPALLVANHQTYMDVNLIWSHAGDVCFTPKAEVRRWPVVGYLVSLFDVVFVDRRAGKSKETQEALQRVLQKGRIICVFPEATTSDGQHMKPFRSALFSLAEEWKGPAPLPVQPVSIRYGAVDGKALNATTWPDVAWFGEITFFAHLWRFLHHTVLEVTLVFHPATALAPGETRKGLAHRCEAVVRSALPFGER